VAGGLLFPLISLVVLVLVYLTSSRATFWDEVFPVVLSLTLYAVMFGVLLGYLAGCATAGVFLILGRIDEALHGPRPEPEPEPGSGEGEGEPDTARGPAWDQRWYDRFRRVLRALRPFQRGRPIGDAAALFVLVVLLVGPTASFPDWYWPWWVHPLEILVAGGLLAMLYACLRLCGWPWALLMVILGLVVLLVGPTASFPDWDWPWWGHLLWIAVAGGLLAVFYAGLRLCGWPWALLMVVLGGAGALVPHVASRHVFYFTDQPLSQYVPLWLAMLLGSLFGFLVLMIVAMLRARKQGPHVRRSRRAVVATVVVLSAVYGSGSLALLLVSRLPRQRALATVYRLGSAAGEELCWSTQPLDCAWLSKEACDDDLKYLAALPELAELNLLGSNVTDAGLAHLKGLTQLRCLWLANTRITGSGLRHLRGNVGLELLSLENSHVTDEGLASLEHFPSITSLDLADTHVTDAVLIHLRNSRNIQYLFLFRTQVTGTGFAHLAEDPGGGGRPSQDDPAGTAIDGVKQGPALWLILDNAPVTDEGLEHIGKMHAVEVLHLRDTKVTDAGLAHLGKLKALRRLNLRGTQVTGRGLQHLKELANLEFLGLDATPTDDAGLAHLGKLSSLVYVSLEDTEISDAGLAQLKGLTAPKELYLSNTSITDDGLVHLKALAKLDELHLDNTAVTDAGLVHLKGLAKLTDLSLRDTAVTDAGLKHLEGLPSLEYVEVDGTAVSPTAASQFEQATKYRVTVSPAPP